MKKETREIRDRRFGEERALYHTENAHISDCRFEGEEDGESALKESRRIAVDHCCFDLRYPFWHDRDLLIADCELTERCRAALWYDRRVNIVNSRLHGVKALRECRAVNIRSCDISSTEFGWRSRGITLSDTKLTSEYAFFMGQAICADNLTFSGKYSFQYVRGARITNSRLTTKDALWHTKDVTVTDSELSGEYLGWYSEGLTLIRCKISGTQPLCYCRSLRLIDCTMEGCDLSFEHSDVRATVSGRIDSVKNPRSGRITAGEIGEIILEDAVTATRCRIRTTGDNR